MAQAITISPRTIAEILFRLDELTKEVRAIKTKLFQGEPPYGSEAWWEWSDKKALDEIKQGKYTELRNKKELNAFLDSLK